MSETEDPRAYEALRIKDQEIERLKTERAGFKSYFEHMENEKDAEIARLKKLITELCDALVESDPFDREIANSLIERAREAVK